MTRLIFCAIILLQLFTIRVDAQLKEFLEANVNESCISDQSDKLLLRTFVMRKFNKYTMGHNGIRQNIAYRANDNYNIGFGFQYKWLGVNLSFQMPLINSDDDKFGKTKFLDLQSYVYLDKIAIDFFALSYRGYYLTNGSLLQTPPAGDDYFIRSDMRTRNYGVNFQYIFNNEKFSYRSSFVQNQCQLQSAGSFIVGGMVHYTRARADSAIIPMNTLDDRFFEQNDFNKSSTITLGINAGYAYTQIIAKHFFITGSLLAGAGLNYTSLKTDATDTRDAGIRTQLHGMIRGAAGYNSPDYFVGLQYINFINRNNTTVSDAWQQLQTGNMRLTFAKRFTLKKKVVKRLEQLEEQFGPPMMRAE